MKYRLNRLEAAGALGDLGTLLPIAIGMILINGLNPTGMFVSIGLYYILSGVYFGVTTPVQPMKVIGAYALATGMATGQILAAGFLMAVFLSLIGMTRLITIIGKYVPKSVVRGVQLSTGTLLMAQGVKLVIGTAAFQKLRGAAEPFLTWQSVGGIPTGIILGVTAGLLALLLLENKKYPAGLVVVVGGLMLGLIAGTREGLNTLSISIALPEILPLGFPAFGDFMVALFALALPQLPMTLGNAVIANADLSKEYFGEDSRKVTYRGLTLSMALANFGAFLVGGMPLCHGAGGLAAHYRFGARTPASNLFIGGIFLVFGLLLGRNALPILFLLPMSILGVLLIFAGSQLALTVMDLVARKDMFVAMLMLGITLAVNLAAGFLVGVVISYLVKSERIAV